MPIISLLYILSSFILIVGATIIYIGDRRSAKHRAFAFLFVTMACWQQSALLIATLPSDQSKYIFVYGLLPLLLASLMFMLHSIYLVTGIYASRRAVYYKLLFIPPILNVMLYPVQGWLYQGELLMYSGPQPSLGPGGYANMVIMAVYMIVMVVVLLPRAVKKHRPSQLLLLGMALFILWALGLIFYGEIFKSVQTFSLVPFGIDFWAATMYISIKKYDSLPSYEKKYNVLFEKAPMGILITDREAVIREASPRVAEYLKFPLHQILGRTIFHWIENPEKERQLSSYADRFDDRITQEFEISFLNGNAQTLILSVSSDYINMEGEVYQLLIINDITEAKLKEQQIHELAYFDQLTGLHNRASFNIAFKEWLKTKSEFVLVLFDLNDFKQINDNYGHIAGDQALKHFADQLKISTTSTDFVARLSGDEFVLLLSRCEDTDQVVQRIKTNLMPPFIPMAGYRLELSVSAGSSIHPMDGSNPDELFKIADDRMYAEKRAKRIS